MIQNIIILIVFIKNLYFRSCALLNLTKSFFTIPFTEQVEYFIIPALAKEQFPHETWTAVLNVAIQDGKLKLGNSSTWLLYSFLKLLNFSKGRKNNNIYLITF